MFVHEPLAPPRRSGLRVGVITDGTTRGGPNGLAEGAARVVECADHCARRDDVALLAAFIVSPQNVMRRGRRFFAALHAEFLRLVEAVTSRRVLAGVRVEVHGRLDRLATRGDAATRLAHTIELLCETTASIQRPRLRLVFCIDYPEDSPSTLGLDRLIRTGMQGRQVLRLSGLRVQQATACIASVELWRHFRPADLDAALAIGAASDRSCLAPGYSCDFVSDLLSELERSRLASPALLGIAATELASEVPSRVAGAVGVENVCSTSRVGLSWCGEQAEFGVDLW